ncbi:MAG: ABC transporter substrate-binding protein [Chloroflexota bacterium]
MSSSLTARLGVVFAAFLFVLAACSGGAASQAPAASPVAALPSATASTSPTSTPVATPSPTPAPSFPLTLTDDEGTSVTLAAEPKKIVSMTPAVTETLFAVGAGDRVVATDDSSDYPAEAKPLPDVVTFGTVDVEKIVALEPDLVIAGGAGFTSADSIAQLRALKIPVLVVSTPSIDGIYKDIGLVGTAVGETDAATAITTKMRADMTAIATAAKAESARTPKPPRVFYDVGYIDGTGQIYGPGEGSFLAEMVGMLGVDVITGDKTTYEVPLETLVSRDPEVIILGVNAFYAPTAETIAKRPGWSKLTAVKKGDVRSVSDTEITRPGPRLATGMHNLAHAMYPDLTLPPAS